ncbi:MAG: transglutaminase family protein [Candidatus Dormibacteria bacterium]
MSELDVILLLLITVVATLAALPGLSHLGQPPSTWRPAPLVTLGLASLLGLACAGVIAATLLGSLGGVGCLAGVAGVMMAAGSARRLPGRGWGLAALLLGGLLVALLLSGQVAGVAAGSNPLASLRQELEGTNPAQTQLLALLMVCWGNGAWIGWVAIRERAGVLACAVPMVVLTADLVNIPAAVQEAPLWPVLAAIVGGLALAGWTHQETSLLRWARLGVPVTGSRPARSLAVVVGCAAGLSALALIVPPLNRTNISPRFFHSGPPVAVTTTQSERIAPLSGYSTSVVPGGPIRQVTTPVLSYRTSAPQGSVYLQGAVLSQFSNGNWYQQAGSQRTVGPGQFLPYSERPSQGTVAIASGRKEVSLRVTYIGAGDQEVADLLYPGSPTQTPLDPGRYVASGELSGHQLLTVATVVPRSGIAAVLPASETITTYGSVSTATPAQLEAAGTSYPAWVLPYTSLPPSGNVLSEDQLAADAVVMAGATTNPYLMAINVQNALRADEIYTLDPPKVPAGVWPIIYFLDQSHRGYCQYFASAMGAMLRTLGVPARLVNGFGPGEEGRLPNGQRLITQADAHTWVQVYFPGYGWVNFEPTPDGFYQPAGAPANTAPRSPTAALLRSHPGVRSGTPSGPGSGRPRHHQGQGFGWIPAALAMGLLLLAAVGMGFAWTRRARSPGQIRRRLEVPVHLASTSDPRARTVPELARACAELAAHPRDLGLGEALFDLARESDRLAFGSPVGAAPDDLILGWLRVRGTYPRLLWRAWRAGRHQGVASAGSAPRIGLRRT